MQHIQTVLDHGFEYIGGDLSTDFINTKSGRINGDGHEHVQTYADVVAFVREAGLLKPAEAKRLVAAAQARPEKATQLYRRAVALREATFRAYERLIQQENRSLLRECADDTCAWLFVDRTKNHSRRWCDMNTCGTRNKMREYRERQKRVARKAR